MDAMFCLASLMSMGTVCTLKRTVMSSGECKTLLAAALCISIIACCNPGAGWAGDEQARAVKAIEKAGAFVHGSSGEKATTYWGLLCKADTNMAVVLKEIRHLPHLSIVNLGKLATDEHLEALAVLPRLSPSCAPAKCGQAGQENA